MRVTLARAARSMRQREESKQFFFAKKNQKTFINFKFRLAWSLYHVWTARGVQGAFGSWRRFECGHVSGL
jgi:hypothetical protein